MTGSIANRAGARPRRARACGLAVGALACAWCGLASAQPVPLGPDELAGVTAATGADTPGGAATRHGPERGAPPSGMGGTDTAADVSETGVIVASDAERASTSTVRLDAGAQADARALNVVNAASSDVAQGVNAANRRAATLTGGAGMHAEQRNTVSQTDIERATVAGLAAGEVLERERLASRTAASSLVQREIAARLDRSVTSRRTTTRLNATVEPDEIGMFDDPAVIGGREVTFNDPLNIDFGDIHVAFSITDLPVDQFNVEVDTTIDLGTFSVGNIKLRTGDITLEGSDIILTAPELVIPSISFTYCFLGGDRTCADDDDDNNVATLTIPGTTLRPGAIRIADANPLGDLGVSFGYAIGGDGSLTFNAGGIEVAGDIGIDPGRISDLVFDLEVPIADQIFSGLEGALTPPSFDIPFDFDVDFPTPDAFDQSLSSEACVYTQGAQSCTPLDRTTEETHVSERSSSDSRHVERSHEASHEHIVIERRRGELVVEEGTADVVVLRDASLAERQYDLVIVGGGAQNRLRAANAVNSAAAIVGNGFNVLADRAASRETGAARRSRLSQTNSFEQIGGL